jgi:hypothetical protein
VLPREVPRRRARDERSQLVVLDLFERALHFGAQDGGRRDLTVRPLFLDPFDHIQRPYAEPQRFHGQVRQ